MSKPSPVSPATSSSAAYGAENSQWIRGIVFVALFAALFIGGSFAKFTPGFTTVPFSLQTFVVMLAGGLLGAVYGFWSILLVVLLTALGLPLMNGSGGFAQVFGATGGFIWMFPVSAFLIGWVSDRLFAGRRKLDPKRIVLLFVAIAVFGVALVYVTGVLWFQHVLSAKFDFQGAMKVAMIPFIPGDLVKAVASVLVIAAVRPALPVIRPAKKQ